MSDHDSAPDDAEAQTPTTEPEATVAVETPPAEPAEVIEEAPAPPPARVPGPVAISAPDLSELPDDIDIDDFEAAIAATVLEFKEGDIVEGTVVGVDQPTAP
jgi:hypothetical protein